MFGMCRTFALTSAIGEYQYTEVGDRALTGAWVMDEVRLAVEKGYNVCEIYDIYKYRVMQFIPKTGEGGLFVDYVNTFLKLKAEANGYPGWVRSPEDEERYVSHFGRVKG